MIEQVTTLIINDLYNDGKLKKAELAALRSSKNLTDPRMVTAYPIIFKYLPDKYIGTNSQPTYVENAIFLALHNYAIIQRGHVENMNGEKSVFYQLSNQRTSGLDRHMQHLMGMTNFDMLKPVLNSIVSQYKQTKPVNFALLAKDLYNMQFDYFSMRHTLMQWGNQYFTPVKKEED